MSEQGPQNVAQAEAEALLALEVGAWRVWQAGISPLPAAYTRWCGAEIERATAGLRNRAEAAEQERDRYKREVMDYEEREAACCPEDVGFDEFIAALRKRAKAAEAEVSRLKAMLEPKPYTPRVGDVVGYHVDCKDDGNSRVVTSTAGDEAWITYTKRGDRALLKVRGMTFMRRATAEERAAAGLPPEPAKPEVLPEHLAYLESLAEERSYMANVTDSSDQHGCDKAAHDLRAAVARRAIGGAE